MTSQDCQRVQADLWRYIDRELPARDMRSVSGHLRSCASCRETHEESVRQVNLYRTALVEASSEAGFDDGFAERFREISERRSSTVDRRWESTQRSGWRTKLTVAAVVLIVPALATMVLHLSTPAVDSVGIYRVNRGLVKFMIEGGANGQFVSAANEYPLRPGSRFEVGRDGILEIFLSEKGSDPVARLEVAGPATFRVRSEAGVGEFRAHLSVGTLHAQVDKRRVDEVFEVETPDALARVVGTRFRLDVLDHETRLDVEEGVVSLSSRYEDGVDSHRETSVSAGTGPHRVGRGDRRPVSMVMVAGDEEAERRAPVSAATEDTATGDAATGDVFPEVSPSHPVPAESPSPPSGLGTPHVDLDTPVRPARPSEPE